MSKLNIPESWAETRLEIICTKITDGTHYTPKLQTSGIPFITVTHLENGLIDFKSAKFITQSEFEKNKANCKPNKNDILFSKDGTVGKVALVNFEKDFIVLSSLAILRPNLNSVTINYLYEFLKSPIALDQAIDKKTGSAIRRIILKNLRSIEIPLPPLGEQKRIVEKIESTQSKIKVIEDNVTQAEALIEKYRESLLQKAFRGELVPQDPNDEPASELLKRIRAEKDKLSDGKKKKKDDLPPITEDEIPFEIPKSWEWVRAGSISEKIGSGQTPKGGNSVYKKSGIPLIRSQNVLNAYLDLSDVAFIDRSTDEDMRGSRVYAGDVLYNITGGSIGRSCVIPPNFLGGNVNQHVLSIRLHPKQSYVAKYMSEFLLSPYGKEFIFKNKKGAARDAITKAQIENLLIPLPPLLEIKKIIEKLDVIERKIDNLKKRVFLIKNNKNDLANSVLSSAFSGCLVPQITSEGTGHELLAQIKSQNTVPELKEPKQSKTKKRKSK